MWQKLFSRIVSMLFSSQSLASYLAETRHDIRRMTLRFNSVMSKRGEQQQRSKGEEAFPEETIYAIKVR